MAISQLWDTGDDSVVVVCSIIVCLAVILGRSKVKVTSALTLLVGQQEGHSTCKKTEWWDAGMVISPERGADLHMAQQMPLPLTVTYKHLLLPSGEYI